MKVDGEAMATTIWCSGENSGSSIVRKTMTSDGWQLSKEKSGGE